MSGDPEYRRPPNAKRIPADPSRQAPNNSYGPPTYYEDAEFTCVDCGRRQVWTAEQQQWWYEVAKGPVDSRAIRCRDCRNARRDAHAGTPRRTQEDRRREAESAPDIG